MRLPEKPCFGGEEHKDCARDPVAVLEYGYSGLVTCRRHLGGTVAWVLLGDNQSVKVYSVQGWIDREDE